MVERFPVRKGLDFPKGGIPLREGEDPAVAELRGRLEAVFALDEPQIFSTIPGRTAPGLTQESFRGNAYDWSRALQEAWKNKFNESGVSLEVAYSDGKDASGFKGESATPSHYYLVDEGIERGYPIIVDITIGQFLIGHNHVFVGTIPNLLEVLREQTGPGNPYQMTGRNATDYRQFFQDYWGYYRKIIKRQ